MTILGPLLMAALMIVPIYLANENQEERIIAVNQQEEFVLEDTEFLHFTTIPNFEATNLTKNFKYLPIKNFTTRFTHIFLSLQTLTKGDFSFSYT